MCPKASETQRGIGSSIFRFSIEADLELRLGGSSETAKYVCVYTYIDLYNGGGCSLVHVEVGGGGSRKPRRKRERTIFLLILRECKTGFYGSAECAINEAVYPTV
jgi:hypothetical protein